MNDLDHERDERDLKVLFDATAETPDGAQLTRLKARAADVPARRRRPLWLAFAPFVAVAAGFFVVIALRGAPEPPLAQGTATNTAIPPLTSALASAEPAPAPSSEEPSSGDDDASFAELDDLYDEPGTDVLAGPLDDADEEELDILLAAADSFLEEG